MQSIPFSAASLITGFQRTGTGFKFVRDVASREVDGRPMKIIEGRAEDSFEQTSRTVFGVATPDETLGTWRLALIAPSDNPRHGYHVAPFFKNDPMFADLPDCNSDSMIGLRGKDGFGTEHSFQVLKPYTLPVAIGKAESSTAVAALGVPYFFDDNKSGVVPVRFEDGTHGIYFCDRDRARLFRSNNREVVSLIKHSTTMPIFQKGVGSSVRHISVTDNGKIVLIKSHYNDKSDRGDVVHR